MPSIQKSNQWFCRIDGQKEFLQEKLKVMLSWIDCTRLLSAHHMGDKKENPHVHFVITLSSELQKQSWDTRFKKLFAPDKKSSWSTKPWDGQDFACSYLFHEDTADVLVVKGFTDADILRFKDINATSQKVQAVNRERGIKRVVERVIDEMGATPWSRYYILKRLLEMIKTGEMYEPGDFMLKRYVEEIYLKSLPDDQFEGYVDERFRNLFPR